jgi:hypothetical protein
MKFCYKCLLFLVLVFIFSVEAIAQNGEKNDTFFLLKKKGLLKKLGESIYRDIDIEPTVITPTKIVDPFLQFDGKRIRFITIAPTGFYTIVHDTVDGKKGNVLEDLGDFFHKNTLPKIVRKNLFFKEGNKVVPREISDNERFLREQPFFRDARIVMKADSNSNFVDVFILTRDVFSLGASANVSNLNKVETVITEENILGSGNKFEITNLYDKERLNDYAFGVSYTKRNIKNTFINWTTGFKNYNTAFNTGQQEENIFYTAFEKPLLSRYNAWTGAAYFAYKETDNQYLLDDSVFSFNYKYKSLTTDIWGGFNIGYKTKKENDNDNRLRHFVAMRTFYNTFFRVPTFTKDIYNSQYANLNGFLTSYSLYKQNFYRTNFIYGFGRNEDVPEGLNATLIGGYTNKDGVERAYYGFEFDATLFAKKNHFISYILRTGTYVRNKQLEDMDLLIGVNGFTKLNKLNNNWRQRAFFATNYTRQMNVLLNDPLVIQSGYSLPYYTGTGVPSDTRMSLKFESVFFNLKKFVGFRFAPFAFVDLSLLKEENYNFKNAKGFTALGGGLRTRNENLVFGTIELKGYYFPRIDFGVKNWRIELASKLRFNFNTSFIRRPEFVSPN